MVNYILGELSESVIPITYIVLLAALGAFGKLLMHYRTHCGIVPYVTQVLINAPILFMTQIILMERGTGQFYVYDVPDVTTFTGFILHSVVAIIITVCFTHVHWAYGSQKKYRTPTIGFLDFKRLNHRFIATFLFVLVGEVLLLGFIPTFSELSMIHIPTPVTFTIYILNPLVFSVVAYWMWCPLGRGLGQFKTVISCVYAALYQIITAVTLVCIGYL